MKSAISLAVTHASLENWEYMETIRVAADPKCSSHLEKSIQTIDSILAHRRFTRPLKALFGLGDLEHDEDFVSVIEVNTFSFDLPANCDIDEPTLIWYNRVPLVLGRPNAGILKLEVQLSTTFVQR